LLQILCGRSNLAGLQKEHGPGGLRLYCFKSGSFPSNYYRSQVRFTNRFFLVEQSVFQGTITLIEEINYRQI
jgi:hypothetical protein